MEPEHFDVLIVGAGLSGIDAAYHLQTRCPARSYAILEARGEMGGTWDLFRYPGVRSDSDMYTLGFPFEPWRGENAIADGTAIRDYLQTTACKYGIDRRVRFGHRVRRADWSSEDARWTLEIATADSSQTLTCFFLYLCSGYYDYQRGYAPVLPGTENFQGTIIHPQSWPQDLDYTGKRMVVIGSGATAMTLVPALAQRAAHVTLLQRSPTYVVSLPARDGVARVLRRLLPPRWANTLARWKNVLVASATFSLARRWPMLMRRALRRRLRHELPAADLDAHFTPRYHPWDQRLCVVPDGDLFHALRSGRASMVTGEIETFTTTGLRLRDGRQLDAEVVVTATGLVLQLFGGMEVHVDGCRVEGSDRLVYKGMMFSDVPNFALAFGYTNLSWTLKCDLTARAVCDLLNHMTRENLDVCTPRQTDPEVHPEPLVDFTSGYFRRAEGTLPQQGSKAPWKVYQSYLRDRALMHRPIHADKALEFCRVPARVPSHV